MKHFSLTEWADFVRGVVTAEQRASMLKHLDEDCSRCKKTVGMWTSVSEFFKHEAACKPPASALRIARSYLAPFKLALGQAQVLRLARPTFDSFERPALAGVRGFDSGPQQLMYQCGSVFIDLRLESKPVTHSMALAGQVVDVGQPGGGLAGIPVSLLSREDNWLETTTNQLGEFHFSFPPAQHLRLLFGMKGTAWLVLLPDSEAGNA
jgi:anti-sigma factor RsiW